jgi:hypothetical protein
MTNRQATFGAIAGIALRPWRDESVARLEPDCRLNRPRRLAHPRHGCHLARISRRRSGLGAHLEALHRVLTDATLTIGQQLEEAKRSSSASSWIMWCWWAIVA